MTLFSWATMTATAMYRYNMKQKKVDKLTQVTRNYKHNSLWTHDLHFSKRDKIIYSYYSDKFLPDLPRCWKTKLILPRNPAEWAKDWYADELPSIQCSRSRIGQCIGTFSKNSWRQYSGVPVAPTHPATCSRDHSKLSCIWAAGGIGCSDQVLGRVQ